MPSDTPSRCEPPEEWREVEIHFLKAHNGKLMPTSWDGTCWMLAGPHSPEEMASRGFIYYSPALPDAAAEIEKLKAENERLIAVLKSHHDWHQEIGVVLFPNPERCVPIEINLSDEYADSTLCSRTIDVLKSSALARERTA